MPTKGDEILDLMVSSTREFIHDVKIGDSLGCSDHELVEFPVITDIG